MPDFSSNIHAAYEKMLERRADPQGIGDYNRLMSQTSLMQIVQVG